MGVALAGGGGHGAVWLHHKITGLPIAAGQRAASTCVYDQIAGCPSYRKRALLRDLEDIWALVSCH